MKIVLENLLKIVEEMYSDDDRIYKRKLSIVHAILGPGCYRELFENLFKLFDDPDQIVQSSDYLELKQLYKSLLSTPGEPRITKNNLIKSLQKGVQEGHFGFGFIQNGQVECVKFKEVPEITLQECEAIVRKELCETIECTEKELIEEITVESEGSKSTTDTALSDLSQVASITVNQPFYKEVTLSVKLPKGKFYEFYRGVLSLLEDSFDETEVEIKIKAKKGKISKSDYENKIRETLIQINAQIMEEETEE